MSEEREGEISWAPPLHTFCFLTIQIKHSLVAVEAESLFFILSDVERATRRRMATKKERKKRQVIQDYSADMSFPWMCYSFSIVFCARRRVQPHLSAPNSPLAPINGAPWTSIDNEIMSSCCLVNAIPLFFSLSLSTATLLSSCFPVSWCAKLISKHSI